MELAAVINGRIRRMSRGVNPSLVSWLTTMMGLRLQVVLEHMPVGPDAILRYVRRIGDPPQALPEEPMEVQEQKELPLSLREKMLPQPLEQQQKKPCPEVHPLLLKEVPETNRMELQPMQSPGQLQSP